MSISNINNSKISEVSASSNAKKGTSATSSAGKNFSDYTKKTYTYSDIFKAASKKYNIPQELLEAVCLTESSFRANATSYCGAQGLMQLMPATAKSLGVKDAYNPIENIMGGAKYLSQMLKKYNGNQSLALAAYNGGPGNVAKYGGVPSFCQSYIDKVLGYVKKGVSVPNKSVTVSTSSRANSLMTPYTNTENTVTWNNKSVESANKIKKDTSKTNSEMINNYSQLYAYAASKYGVPQDILEALSFAESNFNAKAVSSAGAVGLMQLMPATAAELGVKNVYDPVENVLGGAKYLSQLIKRYNGNTTYAVAAYNAGMGNVDKYKGVPPFATSFVNKVLKYAKKGVNIPNITINNSTLSKNNYNKEGNRNKKLIDLQV